MPADFLGDPTGTGWTCISRCSGEVETSNASDPLSEGRVALQTAVSAMVRKSVTIVGSGMGLHEGTVSKSNCEFV